jgi:hypothetical protein
MKLFLLIREIFRLYVVIFQINDTIRDVDIIIKHTETNIRRANTLGMPIDEFENIVINSRKLRRVLEQLHDSVSQNIQYIKDNIKRFFRLMK